LGDPKCTCMAEIVKALFHIFAHFPALSGFRESSSRWLIEYRN